jgi:gamma-carbonic anhydrase
MFFNKQGALIEAGAVVGDGSVVPPGRLVPAGQIWAGNPVSYVGPVHHDDHATDQDGTLCYDKEKHASEFSPYNTVFWNK